MDTKKESNKTHKKHRSRPKDSFDGLRSPRSGRSKTEKKKPISVFSKHYTEKNKGMVADVFVKKFEGKPSDNEYIKGESTVIIQQPLKESNKSGGGDGGDGGGKRARSKAATPPDDFCPKLTDTRYRMLELIQKIEKKPNYGKITKQFPEKWRRVKELYVMLSKLDKKDAECETRQTKLEGDIIKILEFFKKELEGRGSLRKN